MGEKFLDMFGLEVKPGDDVVVIGAVHAGSKAKRLLKGTFTGKFQRKGVGVFTTEAGSKHNLMSPSVVVPKGVDNDG